MSTVALQTQSGQTQALTTLSELLNRYKEQIAMALPRHLTPERMIRVALTAVGRNPTLQKCSPATIAGCVVQASILGLEPDGVLGEAYLVPFYNKKANSGRGGYECQLIPGYQGLLKLVRNTGELKMVDVQEVCENDEFDFEKGMEPYLRHKPAVGDRGEVVSYWAGAVLINGGKQFEVMTKEQIEQHRDRYSKSAESGPWVTSPEWMFKKTVLRKMVKLLPKSAQAQLAVAIDEHAEVGIAQRFAVDVPIELQQTGDSDEEGAQPEIKAPQRLSESKAEPAVVDEAAEKKRLRASINKQIKEMGWDETRANQFFGGRDINAFNLKELTDLDISLVEIAAGS
jgi:recombination protein RecT